MSYVSFSGQSPQQGDKTIKRLRGPVNFLLGRAFRRQQTPRDTMVAMMFRTEPGKDDYLDDGHK